jgi:hypothetical protein
MAFGVFGALLVQFLVKGVGNPQTLVHFVEEADLVRQLFFSLFASPACTDRVHVATFHGCVSAKKNKGMQGRQGS